MRRLWRCLALMPLALACSATGAPAPSTTAPTPTEAPVRVLMLTATAGFRHESIPTARQVIADLAPSSGFTVAATETLADITPTRLASTDVLMFALTSGELAFDAAQKAAIVAFVNDGGGFIGVHSASDTLYEWPDYGRLVGAYFKEHPWTTDATVSVEDRAHPITAGLGGSFRLNEEFYTFRTNPRASTHVLLSLDAASVGAAGDFPLAWTQTIGRGRCYYNALGHFESTWREGLFQRQMVNAIRWTAGR